MKALFALFGCAADDSTWVVTAAAAALQQADLLVCDANDHVKAIPRFLGPVLPRLKSGAWLVLTLKFYGRGNKQNDVEQQMAESLPVIRGWAAVGVQHMCA